MRAEKNAQKNSSPTEQFEFPVVVRVNSELLGEDVDIYNDLCYIW